MGIGTYNQYNQPTGIAGLLNQMRRTPVVQEPVQPSMIEQMVARANLASQNATVPSLNALFPYMNYQSPASAGYGAARFLGNAPTVSQSAPSIPFNFAAPKA